ncbi:MAG TPA: response regulator transcription factor, partial [Chloroflexota bacterium]|nr:response regulator transcription factor [Chloroflexota bacterium]
MSPGPIRVLIAEDQRVMADALRVVLELEGDITVVGVVDDGSAAVSEALRLKPDVVVMDVHLASVGGLAATRTLLGRWPEARVLVLTTDESPRLVGESAAAGAVGHLTKDRALADVIGAVRRVARGEMLFSAAELRRAIRDDSPAEERPTLSARELEVLALIATGREVEEVADQLCISPLTLRTHVQRILHKL